MKRVVVVIIFMLLFPLSGVMAQQVTMQSLLREMVDRDYVTMAQPYRTLQASSYNRASVSPDKPGWFADSDGVSCIRTEQNSKGETEWVLMEDEGPGAIVKIWAVCFYYNLSDRVGANVKIYLNGECEPSICCNFFDFVQGKDFVKPPFASETTRAGNCYLPIPYAKGCKVTMDKKVFYNIINYHHYPKETDVRTFSMEEYANSSELIDSVGKVLTSGCLPDSRISEERKQTLAPGESMQLSLKSRKAGAIRFLSLKIDAKNHNQALRSTVVKASFDGEQTIWSPIGDFFNIGPGVKTYKMWERSVEEDGTMLCRWVMPYKHESNWQIENLGSDTVVVDLSLLAGSYRWSENSMYFHSNWKMGNPTPGFPLFDFNLLKVHGTGLYVGDQLTVLNPREGWWGEGDEKVYVDSDTFPSHFGTGTEDYYGWAGGVMPSPSDEFSRPFLANVRVASPNTMGYNTCTRTRALDAIPFCDSIEFNMEAPTSQRKSWHHMLFSTSAFWYARPGAVSSSVPLPKMASQKLMAVSELQAFNELCKNKTYVFPGAIEAENLDTYSLSGNISDGGQVTIWGDLSGGNAKGFSISSVGASVKVRLTELFDRTRLKVCLATVNNGGEFDIIVNGKTAVERVNLLSEHSAVATIDLGEFNPEDNALELEFLCLKPGMLALDYFLAE